MIYLLDTDTCIHVLRGVRRVVDRLAALSPDDCGISSVTAYELFTGAGKAKMPEREGRRIGQLLEVVEVLFFDTGAAREAGRIRVELEKEGRNIGPYDLLIAGQAVASKLILVTGNQQEFSRVPDLKLEDWHSLSK